MQLHIQVQILISAAKNTYTTWSFDVILYRVIASKHFTYPFFNMYFIMLLQLHMYFYFNM